ncbi:tachykinin-like peptides receptor 99D [Mizuhopecten yessoensis]|uniref:Trace amine-associated receptor 7g n=1 Tax=Mizuhopecten yessoensis TaxID=6573 RepID=A0A210PUR7_MIZYE|nr:tachykinin-like peptides receptor 99D [Mizuhopecten yessoensis]XP_021374735.1 tachykinin-like peptides receptor 99D [Mizuhopecten yessoensis]XP_021374736.1 tachykinin-like peptides receptor 99D [Mizuhopecten yessoensis]XP_021374737.1 tachykinin-like peptides receptor 99D [Mizuhopecten yessoensis]XP_021374739.1 tachykinin-like peptides receptor 99D [Mizuhopecten yessoensis]OWF40247.1 Trace amine-associated receptor 7g [Mizuhopecten yessoensis]
MSVHQVMLTQSSKPWFPPPQLGVSRETSAGRLSFIVTTNTTDFTEQNTEFTEHHSYLFYVKVILIFVIMVCTTLGNLLNIAVTLKTRSLRTPSGNFIISLATADLMVGILVTFSFVSSIQDKWAFSDSVCKAVGFIFFYATSLSMWNLLVLTIDRWVSVTRPMKYVSWMTNRTSYKIIGLVWLGVLLIDFPMLLPGVGDVYYIEGAFLCSPNWRVNLIYTFLLVAVHLLPSFILVLAFNLRLYCISRKHVKEMELLQIQSQTAVKPSSIKPKLVITTIVMAFEISWMPFLVAEIIRLFSPSSISVPVSFIVSWVAVSNSLMNSVIYTCLNRKFRHGIVTLFRCKDIGTAELTGYVDSNFV